MIIIIIIIMTMIMFIHTHTLYQFPRTARVGQNSYFPFLGSRGQPASHHLAASIPWSPTNAGGR